MVESGFDIDPKERLVSFAKKWVQVGRTADRLDGLIGIRSSDPDFNEIAPFIQDVKSLEVKKEELLWVLLTHHSRGEESQTGIDCFGLVNDRIHSCLNYGGVAGHQVLRAMGMYRRKEEELAYVPGKTYGDPFDGLTNIYLAPLTLSDLRSDRMYENRVGWSAKSLEDVNPGLIAMFVGSPWFKLPRHITREVMIEGLVEGSGLAEYKLSEERFDYLRWMPNQFRIAVI